MEITRNNEKQSEFRFDQNSARLPMYGVGPLYVISIGALTFLVILLDRLHVLPAARSGWGQLLFILLGVILIIAGVVLWIRAVLKDKVDDGIAENHLITSGAYACVRNPIYSAFTLLFSGALLVNGNMLTFVLPVFYWLFMTVLLKRTEEKWLAERYGAKYKAYCCRVNRCISGIPERNTVYESEISDARWIAYDLPGNIGWILYFVGVILAFAKRLGFIESKMMLQLMVVAIIPALLMAVGIAELISERIKKLDRVLPRIRLLRGFGALTLGGITGTAVAAALLLCGAATGTHEPLYIWLMLAGGVLCGVFAGLLFRQYKRK